MQKKIHIILPRIEGSKKTKHKILKVAIYCRVSKNTPEQLRSLEIQEIYFEKLVSENADWKLYKIYKDVGSGTRRGGRDGYIEMLKDAQKHRFDLILVMLSNEKYMGNLLLQKTCTPDFLTGKQKKNCGEQSMFLVENAHEPIVSKEIFEDVQRRKHKM